MTTGFGNLYIGNKMAGVPFFNAPWFDSADRALHRIVTGIACTFNPAEHDRNMGFDPMLCPRGSLEEAENAGFVLRKALGSDWEWIAKYSHGMIAGPDWASSRGTISEIACHQALRLPVWSYATFLGYWDDPDITTERFTLQQLTDMI